MLRIFWRARVLLMVLGVSGALVAMPTPASAYVPGPPCYGPTCVGKSPYIVNRQGISCVNDAVNLKTVSAPGDGTSNQVTLRWSNYCHANWARWSGSNVNYADYWAETWNGHRELPHGYYTYMVDGTQLAQAVVVAYTFNSNDCPNACGYTGWY